MEPAPTVLHGLNRDPNHTDIRLRKAAKDLENSFLAETCLRNSQFCSVTVQKDLPFRRIKRHRPMRPLNLFEGQKLCQILQQEILLIAQAGLLRRERRRLRQFLIHSL